MNLLKPITGISLVVAVLLILVACQGSGNNSAEPVDHGSLDKTETQWFPYLEWTLLNPSYSGNPYDLAADVRFTHPESGEERITQMFFAGNDSWKFRFTGTRGGVWLFTTFSNDPNLDGVEGEVTIEPNPDPNARGFIGHHENKWMWTGSGDVFVPQYVMYRTPRYFYQQPGKVAADIQTWFVDHGFNGLHVLLFNAWFDIYISEGEEMRGSYTDLDTRDPNPDPRTFEALEMLIMAAYQAGGAVHIWQWGDEERRQTPIGLAGGINGTADRRLQRYIAARLGPLPGWTMGYGYDNWEWNSGSDQDAWHAYLHQHFGWQHLLGARWEKNQLTQATERLDYSSYEQHKPDYDTYVQTIRQRPNKPSFSEDRFRGGFPVEDPENKHYSPEDVRRGLWHSTMAGGVANIWGRWNDGTQGNSVWNEGGSFPFDNKEEIQTYAAFFKERFLKEMEPDNRITNGYALVDTTNAARYIFYREDTDEIYMDLSGMNGSQPAVAVNTLEPYNEIQLGELDAAQQTWTAPYPSDWSIAVGVFK